MEVGPFEFYDKIPLKSDYAAAGVRVNKVQVSCAIELDRPAENRAGCDALARFVGLPRALLFSSGYMANSGIVPALAGVDATSPAYGGGATWRTRDGIDRETDAALRQRCRDRWATLSSGFPQAAVRYWATSARLADGSSAGCTRVGFGDIDGIGGYVVYVATTGGTLSAPGVAAVQAELNARKPQTDKPSVVAATQITITIADRKSVV